MLFSLCFTPAFSRVKGLKIAKINAKCRSTAKDGLSTCTLGIISLIAYDVQNKQDSFILSCNFSAIMTLEEND